MLNWIVQNGEILFAGVVAASTVAYAILTRSLVAETKKLREVQTEPKIAVWVRPKEEAITFAHLYVRNIGLGPAFDVSFEIGEETETPGGQMLIKDFSEAQFLNTGLKYLGPGQEMRAGFTKLSKNTEEKIKAVLTVKTKYRSATRKKYENVYQLEMAEFKDYRMFGYPPLHSIAENLQKIQEQIEHFATGFHKLKVDVYDSTNEESK